MKVFIDKLVGVATFLLIAMVFFSVLSDLSETFSHETATLIGLSVAITAIFCHDYVSRQ